MIVVFGSINLDLVFPVPALPQAGQTVLSAEGRIEPGGKGANQAVAAARDGGRVVFVGAVGRDLLADQALDGLVQAGVDVSRVKRCVAATGRASVCVAPDGRNAIAVAAGANQQVCAAQVEAALLGRRASLLLQMETPPEENAALIRRARAAGCRIILNLAPARVIETDALRSVDLIVGNSQEIAWLGTHLGTGNNAASVYAALGVPIIRTLEVQGAEAFSEAGYLHMPALTVDARDSTGAGDVFTGVLAAALHRGASLPDAMRRACVAAALSVTRMGAQASVPQAHEIDAAMAYAPHVSSRQPEIID